MTTGQRQYADLQRQLAEIKPTPKAQRPKSKICSFCYGLVADKRGPFNKLMMTIVILNICVIATEFQNEPTWLTKMQGNRKRIQSVLLPTPYLSLSLSARLLSDF